VKGGGVRLSIRCIPRGGADRIDGVVDGSLRVRVAAPAVDGAANDALLRLLAIELGIPRSAIRLIAGETGRNKVVAIEGIDSAGLVAHWPDLAV
jgi:uncharacterized protein YggU (UPF0235/DUF167 family)